MYRQLYSRNKLVLEKSSKSVTTKPATTLQIVKEFINNGGLVRPKIEIKVTKIEDKIVCGNVILKFTIQISKK